MATATTTTTAKNMPSAPIYHLPRSSHSRKRTRRVPSPLSASTSDDPHESSSPTKRPRRSEADTDDSGPSVRSSSSSPDATHACTSSSSSSSSSSSLSPAAFSPAYAHDDWAAIEAAYDRAVSLAESEDTPVQTSLTALRQVLAACARFLDHPTHEPRCPSPHALFGTALVHAGRLLAREPALATADDTPLSPSNSSNSAAKGNDGVVGLGGAAGCYLRAALGVFEAGAPTEDDEDGWKPLVGAGRALLALADICAAREQREARVRRVIQSARVPPASSADPVVSHVTEEEEEEEGDLNDPRPLWPRAERYAPGTPLAAASDLAARGGESARGRYHYAGGSANAVLARATELLEDGLGRSDAGASRLLHALAREVLQPAARLPVPAQRARWAGWAGALLARAEEALPTPPSPVLVPLSLSRKRAREEGGEIPVRSALVLLRARARLLEGTARAAGGDVEGARAGLREALELVNRAEADETQCRRVRADALAEMRMLAGRVCVILPPRLGLDGRLEGVSVGC